MTSAPILPDPRLLPGREIPLGVHPSDDAAQCRLRRRDGLLAPRPVVRRAGRRAMQRPRLLRKGPRQHLGVLVEQVEAQVVLPRLERRRLHRGGQPRRRGGLPHHERLLPRQPRLTEERRPVHPRRPPREVGARPHAVGVVVVGRGLLCGLGPGERRLERHHRRRALLRMIEAGQREHPADVLLVSRAERLHGGIAAHVRLTVWQAESSLQQEGDVALLAVERWLDRQSEQSRGAVDAPVEGVDVGGEPPAEEPGQGRPVVYLSDAVEERLERRDAARLDGGHVQIRAPVVGDHACGGSRRRGGGIVQQSSELLAGEFADLVARVPPLLARGDLGGVEPDAVGVGVEVVAGPDAGVHSGLEGRCRLATARLRAQLHMRPRHNRHREECRLHRVADAARVSERHRCLSRERWRSHTGAVPS